MIITGGEYRGTALTPGHASGEWVGLSEPLSFWGGVDATGRVIDVHHPQCGTDLKDKVVGMRAGRGSSSAAAVLAEQLRADNAPRAIVMTECDTILVIGALVAAELYGKHMPIIQVEEPVFKHLRGHVTIAVNAHMTAELVVEETQ